MLRGPSGRALRLQPSLTAARARVHTHTQLTRFLLHHPLPPPRRQKSCTHAPTRQACEAADYLTKLPDRIRKLNERAMARKQKQKGTQSAFAWVFDRPVELV